MTNTPATYAFPSHAETAAIIHRAQIERSEVLARFFRWMFRRPARPAEVAAQPA